MHGSSSLRLLDASSAVDGVGDGDEHEMRGQDNGNWNGLFSRRRMRRSNEDGGWVRLF